MTTSAPAPAARPRLWRLQFSLRFLLVAFTIFAIGFSVWYRWPYEEIVAHTAADGSHVQRITTWQRQWGGGRLKHGIDRLFVDGSLLESTTYDRGKKHGLYISHRWSKEGQPDTTGQYFNDVKEGTWVSRSFFKHTAQWRAGLLDGPAVIESLHGKRIDLLFAAGRLKEINGQPAHGRLFERLHSGLLDQKTTAALLQPTDFDFIQWPLVDVLVHLQKKYYLPIMLDNSRIADKQLPIIAACKGIDLCSALTLLTFQNDLACDYRYGLIWITTADDADDWHDPTGVADIQPPPDSPLARAWDEPTGLGAIDEPLAPVLARITKRLAIDIDTSRIAPNSENPHPFPITAREGGLPFHHALALALYKSRCRCTLDGEKLVIHPPPAAQ